MRARNLRRRNAGCQAPVAVVEVGIHSRRSDCDQRNEVGTDTAVVKGQKDKLREGPCLSPLWRRSMLDVTVVVTADRRLPTPTLTPTPSLSFVHWLQAFVFSPWGPSELTFVRRRLSPDAASESHCPFSLAWAL